MLQHDDTWEFGPDLPYPEGLHSHCVTPLTLDEDEETFVLIGGLGVNAVGGNVQLSHVNSYNFKTEIWEDLTSLPERRFSGACAPFTIQGGDDIIIYAGK